MLGSVDSDFTSERGAHMADQYKCKKCGGTSSKPGNCCGQPMQKVS